MFSKKSKRLNHTSAGWSVNHTRNWFWKSDNAFLCLSFSFPGNPGELVDNSSKPISWLIMPGSVVYTIGGDGLSRRPGVVLQRMGVHWSEVGRTVLKLKCQKKISEVANIHIVIIWHGPSLSHFRSAAISYWPLWIAASAFSLPLEDVVRNPKIQINFQTLLSLRWHIKPSISIYQKTTRSE